MVGWGVKFCPETQNPQEPDFAARTVEHALYETFNFQIGHSGTGGSEVVRSGEDCTSSRSDEGSETKRKRRSRSMHCWCCSGGCWILNYFACCELVQSRDSRDSDRRDRFCRVSVLRACISEVCGTVGLNDIKKCNSMSTLREASAGRRVCFLSFLRIPAQVLASARRPVFTGLHYNR